jgi:hypothetical protein
MEAAIAAFCEAEGLTVMLRTQWEDTMSDLIPDIENVLDRTWPNHIPPREDVK